MILMQYIRMVYKRWRRNRVAEGQSPLPMFIEGVIAPLEIVQKTFLFSHQLSLFSEEVCKSIII